MDADAKRPKDEGVKNWQDPAEVFHVWPLSILLLSYQNICNTNFMAYKDDRIKSSKRKIITTEIEKKYLSCLSERCLLNRSI